MTLAMSTTTIQQKPSDASFVFSIGIAVDLVELERAMKEFAQQPWAVDDSEGQDSGEREGNSCSERVVAMVTTAEL